jgi:Zn-dependent protease with chaperone function
MTKPMELSGDQALENAGATEGRVAKAVALAAVATGFDVASVRCAVETRLEELIRKDEGLAERIKALAKERKHVQARNLLDLMTDGYRVDEAITPRLVRLGAVLTKALRLVHPLDVFVWPSNERNAYCLPSRKGNRLIMCVYSGLVSSLSSRVRLQRESDSDWQPEERL